MTDEQSWTVQTSEIEPGRGSELSETTPRNVTAVLLLYQDTLHVYYHALYTMSEGTAGGLRRRRISRACDYCHQRSKRCHLSTGALQCQNCAAFQQACTFHRPQKRRGAPPRQKLASTASASPGHSQGVLVHRTTPSAELATARSDHWQAPFTAGHAIIVDLVELYFEIIYPIFPLFHQPSFVRRIARAEYTLDRPLFSITMAVCALVSARIRDGAVFNPRWDTKALQETPTDVYRAEAVQQVTHLHLSSNLNTLRARAILALAAIQDGKIREMHEHLGFYHTIMAMEGLHDEENWHKDIGVIEREERRRLFWSIYTLDVFTSLVWGGVVRSREYQSNVAYPTEVDDDMFDEMGIGTMHSSSQRQSDFESFSWIAGRNVVIDLYRVIEHVMIRLSAQRIRAQRSTLIDEIVQAESRIPTETLRNSVMQMYADLPQCFKETNALTSKPSLDRFGFQAADIVATVQLLRMVLLSASGASISEKSQIAIEVVNAFVAIPTSYHHAVSVPLLYHLGIIGQILLSTLEQPLDENNYRDIRDVMIAMVQLLSTLEGLHRSKGASQRLSDQITRIDEYMTFQKANITAQPRRSPRTNPTVPFPHESLHEAVPSSIYDSAAGNAPFATSPFQLPPELLGNFSDIFDLGQF